MKVKAIPEEIRGDMAMVAIQLVSMTAGAVMEGTQRMVGEVDIRHTASIRTSDSIMRSGTIWDISGSTVMEAEIMGGEVAAVGTGWHRGAEG
mmetsp:Transcript_28203/g.44907  ORF Transcript_28203/g.44907 Transcript_28203/m.44907 type:complete len:92 (+) Transcript_28203:1024-1299(+)